MTTRTDRIRVSNLMIDTVKKNIKHMHLGVYPPNGRVRVAAPSQLDDEAIRLFVLSRMNWIRRQQQKFLEQERQTSREYVSGESHYFLGKRYRLNIIQVDGKPKLEIRNRAYINLHVKPEMTTRQREDVIERFYRSELNKIVPGLVGKWQKKLDLKVSEVWIKKMKTRWGTCNPRDKRLWLNLELAKAPLHCIEYVFVHEMIHLIEKNHSERFMQLLEDALPHWRRYKEELNYGPLGHFKWDCNA